MPNIIINEYDNTKAGIATTGNFSVVVPGFCGHRIYGVGEVVESYPCLKVDADDGCIYYYKTETSNAILVFDENGVYECSNQKLFVEYIGKHAATEVGICATYIVPEHTITEEEFNDIYKNRVYSFESITAEADKKPGKYKVHNDIGWFKLNKVTTYAESEAAQYTIIGYEGTDNAIGNGNQITYELLGLGYTVLFKHIERSKIVKETTTYEDIECLKFAEFWECLLDRASYKFRYLCTGDYIDSDAYAQICRVARHRNELAATGTESIQGRGECIAFIDVDETTLGHTQKTFTDSITSVVNSLSFLDLDSTKEIKTEIAKYAAICAPHLTYVMDDSAITDFAKNRTFPCSFHYLACAAKARVNKYKEWFAIAGYNRGISDYTVESTSIKLGEIAVNFVQPRKIDSWENLRHAVNIIIKDKNGYYLWGNRTAYQLDVGTTADKDLVASHFLNIRQLCCTLKKELYDACRKFTFDPNSDILWANFCAEIRPVLEEMKANQGIKDYKIIPVKSTQKAILTAKIKIVPIEAVEDFKLGVYLEDSIAGTVVDIDEE